MKSNLEKELIDTDWVLYKCTINNVYCQNLYAALCDNIFIKNDCEWFTSWRNAGTIVSNLIKYDERHFTDSNATGDYLDWYCSGASAGSIPGYVDEGFVTSEISNDLLNLGWTYKPITDPNNRHENI